jgi:AraC-like DNA-binding protein
MSLPVEDLASVSEIADCDLSPPRDGVILTPLPLAMAELQRMHAVAGRLAEEAPEVIAHSEAARGLEQSLIHAMVDCLSMGHRREETAACRRLGSTMRRFHTVLEAHPDQALHLPELCTLLGVAERTLQRCCHEHLGIGPKQFLLLRRMHLARRALRQADMCSTTVTAIATQFGFSELGRFAVIYKSLFGEQPSLTLRRPPD